MQDRLRLRKNPIPDIPPTGCVDVYYDSALGAVAKVEPDGTVSEIGTGGTGDGVTNATVNAAIAEDPEAIRVALQIDPSTSGGTISSFRWHSEQIVIADGPDSNGRNYHAFPDLQKVGDTYWLTHMTSGGHADRRADLVVKSSTDLRTWTEKTRFASTRPTGTIEVGDVEYRAGTIVGVGGGVLVCVMHKFEVTNAGTLAGNNSTAWSISVDNGTTWSTPQELPRINASYYAIAGMQCAVWNGKLYAPAYSNNNAGAGFYIADVAAIKMGVPNWSTLQVALEQEPCAMVDPTDPDRLLVFSRTNDTKLLWHYTTDGANWSYEYSFYSALAETNIGMKPLMAYLQTGKWLFAKRKDGASSLIAEMAVGENPFTEYSGDGNPDDELWPITRFRSFPNPAYPFIERAYSGAQKLMYAGIVPLGGDLAAVAWAIEPQEMNNTAADAGGSKASVFLGLFGSGSGFTPFGEFDDAVHEIDSPSVNLNTSPDSLRYWMTANTEFEITNGTKTVALEIFGDFAPTFASGGTPITPTGSYDADAKNIAVISPGPSVQIINTSPESPYDIPGLRESIIGQFSPSGIEGTTTITAWKNEADTSYVAKLTAGTTAPTILSTGSPNGNPALQGASNAYLDNAGGNVPLSGVYALCTAEGAVWAGDYSALVTNAIQGQGAGSATWQVSSPYSALTRYKNGVVDNPAAAPSTSWAIIGHRQRPLTIGTGSNYAEPAVSNISVIMSQSGITVSRGWRGKCAAIVLVRGDHFITDREDYLIRRWMRSL